MGLTSRQKSSFKENGYLALPQAVPTPRIERALRSVNRYIGDKKRGLLTPQNVEFFSEMEESPSVMNLLLETPLWAACESLVGPGKLERPRSANITLAAPVRGPEAQFASKDFHIDGFPSLREKREIQTFTLFACVLLSDVPGKFMGNFTVCAGSHRFTADYLRRNGYRHLNRDLAAYPYPDVRQITGKAGDAVLCHYNLAHSREWNSSPHIRYAVFFRLQHVEHRRRWREALGDLWLEWEGLADAPPARARRTAPV